MEDVLGGRTDPTRFTAFLGNWQTILARWVDAAVAAFATVEGVIGLVLAGSVGRNEPWPLSDIDLLPIYDDAQINEARVEFERRRMALLAPWITEGWLDWARYWPARVRSHRGRERTLAGRPAAGDAP